MELFFKVLSVAKNNQSQNKNAKKIEDLKFHNNKDLKKLNIKTDYLSRKSLEKVDSSKIMSFLLSQL